MTLSSEHKKRYRAIGHKLKPVVTVAGNGLSEGVSAELNRALDDHELIKIKLALEDREDRRRILQQIQAQHQAHIVQVIGKTALLFRAADKPNLKKSNAR